MLEWRQRFGLVETRLDPRQPNRHLEALTQELGLRLIDVSDAMQPYIERGENLHMETDDHLNARGHEVLASVLEEPLIRDLLAPAALIGTR